MIAHKSTVTGAQRLADGGLKLSISRLADLEALRGDSIAINGVCLTVVDPGDPLAFDVVPETVSRTNLSELRSGDQVNLEASLRAGDPLGGHLVYGHVDATTVVLSKSKEGEGARMWCVTPPELAPLIAEKGSVALEGVSLTVAAVREGEFAVALIPETLSKTTLGDVEEGSSLNLEVDPIARYAVHALKYGGRR
ncbi:MAG TPA: riboflavin synthase [Candidatus Eremiobacteraceae bacterium]|nr:riboflavin synthase [Candidatus Eremiobacteraceae bacterium]